jgi:hypothetical protein
MSAMCEQFCNVGGANPSVDSVVSRDVLEEAYVLMTFRYGVDGSWSAITIGVGTEDPQQWMDVMVSTVSSETWVVRLHGCGMFGEFIPFPNLFYI